MARELVGLLLELRQLNGPVGRRFLEVGFEFGLNKLRFFGRLGPVEFRLPPLFVRRLGSLILSVRGLWIGDIWLWRWCDRIPVVGRHGLGSVQLSGGRTRACNCVSSKYRAFFALMGSVPATMIISSVRGSCITSPGVRRGGAAPVG